MKKYILSIDRGCTNTKIVLFDYFGNEIKVYTQKNKAPIYGFGGVVEIDLNIMRQEVFSAIKAMVNDIAILDEIGGVGVVGQGSGLYLFDGQGQPLRAGIVSLDTRTKSDVVTLTQAGLRQRFEDMTNATLMPDKPHMLLRWIKEHEPSVYGQIHTICFAKDWINYSLCGRFCTDYTDASSAGLLHKNTLTFCPEPFNFLGIAEMATKFPPILASHQQIGCISDQASLETGLPAGIPIVCGAHDLQTFPFGVGSLEETTAVSIIGTWGTNIVPYRRMESEERKGFAHIVPTYNVAAKFDCNSGVVLDKMRALLYPNLSYQEIEDAMAQCQETSVLFVPYLYGKPGDEHATGNLRFLQAEHTQRDVIRAIYEGVVFGHYANILALPQAQCIKTIWLIGGGAKSNTLCQLFADISGATIYTATFEEITARGMALNVLVGLGVYADHEQACIQPPIKQIYIPNREKYHYYQEKFALYEQVQKNNV